MKQKYNTFTGEILNTKPRRNYFLLTLLENKNNVGIEMSLDLCIFFLERHPSVIRTSEGLKLKRYQSLNTPLH